MDDSDSGSGPNPSNNTNTTGGGQNPAGNGQLRAKKPKKNPAIDTDQFKRMKSAYKDHSSVELVPEELAVKLFKNKPTTSRVKSIAGEPIADISAKTLEAFVPLMGLSGTSKCKSKKQYCDLISQTIINNAAYDDLEKEPDKNPPQSSATSSKQVSINYERLINCLFHPSVFPLYEQWFQQPNKDTLTAYYMLSNSSTKNRLSW